MVSKVCLIGQPLACQQGLFVWSTVGMLARSVSLLLRNLVNMEKKKTEEGIIKNYNNSVNNTIKDWINLNMT